MSRIKEKTLPNEQLVISVRGVKVAIRGYALLILALGIAATMGANVVVRMSF
jgi:hypothetical protein